MFSNKKSPFRDSFNNFESTLSQFFQFVIQIIKPLDPIFQPVIMLYVGNQERKKEHI